LSATSIELPPIQIANSPRSQLELSQHHNLLFIALVLQEISVSLHFIFVCSSFFRVVHHVLNCLVFLVLILVCVVVFKIMFGLRGLFCFFFYLSLAVNSIGANYLVLESF